MVGGYMGFVVLFIILFSACFVFFVFYLSRPYLPDKNERFARMGEELSRRNNTERAEYYKEQRGSDNISAVLKKHFDEEDS
jgi:hypothetical protein